MNLTSPGVVLGTPYYVSPETILRAGSQEDRDAYYQEYLARRHASLRLYRVADRCLRVLAVVALVVVSL